MTRYELVRMLVLNEIADDYEASAHIQERVSDLGRECELLIDAADVNLALLDLVKSGWAKAYDLWKEPREELQVVPKFEQIGEHYYWITPQGREVLSAFEGWPFDDEGALLPGWHAPAN